MPLLLVPKSPATISSKASALVQTIIKPPFQVPDLSPQTQQPLGQCSLRWLNSFISQCFPLHSNGLALVTKDSAKRARKETSDVEAAGWQAPTKCAEKMHKSAEMGFGFKLLPTGDLRHTSSTCPRWLSSPWLFSWPAASLPSAFWDTFSSGSRQSSPYPRQRLLR